MDAYSLRIKASAAKELEAVEPLRTRQRLVSRIRALAREPRPPGSQKLAGDPERYRIRQGRYRVLYTVDDEGRTVEVVGVAHRREAYR